MFLTLTKCCFCININTPKPQCSPIQKHSYNCRLLSFVVKGWRACRPTASYFQLLTRRVEHVLASVIWWRKRKSVGQTDKQLLGYKSKSQTSGAVIDSSLVPVDLPLLVCDDNMCVCVCLLYGLYRDVFFNRDHCDRTGSSHTSRFFCHFPGWWRERFVPVRASTLCSHVSVCVWARPCAAATTLPVAANEFCVMYCGKPLWLQQGK